MSSLQRRPSRGFTHSEGVIVFALISILAVFTVAYLRTISRRESLLRNARNIQSLLISARQSAMKQKAQVVVSIDLAQRRIVTWVDQTPDFVQEAGEPVLSEYRVPSDVFFRYSPGAEATDGPSAVCFDGYGGKPSLVDRIVFRGDGSVVPPESVACGAPRTPRRFSPRVPIGSIDCNPGNRCRGIYLADSPAAQASPQNTLRVSVDDPGKPRTVTILKWLPGSEGGNPQEIDYVPPPWRWAD